jgi:hypothetical protein
MTYVRFCSATVENNEKRHCECATVLFVSLSLKCNIICYHLLACILLLSVSACKINACSRYWHSAEALLTEIHAK